MNFSSCKAVVLRPVLSSLVAVSAVIIISSSSAYAQWAKGTCSRVEAYTASGYTGIGSFTPGGTTSGDILTSVSIVMAHTTVTVPAGYQEASASIGFGADFSQRFNYTGTGTPPILSTTISGYVEITGNGGQGMSASSVSDAGSCQIYYARKLNVPSPGTKNYNTNGNSNYTAGFTLKATSMGRAYGVGNSFDAESKSVVTYSVQ